jgi:peptidoglycan/xylan/chitin deacetylase (PgdA/CDA1 family)
MSERNLNMDKKGPSHLSEAPPKAETAHWARWAGEQPDWQWPNGKDVAVTLSFDVDAETGYYSAGEEYFSRLSSLSEGRFSVVRAVPRILELLRRYDLRTTFFVPGWTAESYPHVVEAILKGGHEIGHHGYVHSRTDHVSLDAQREEIEKGFSALESVGAPRPRGYRSTSWEVTPETFRMIGEYGFLYDSSFFADDRPYIEKLGDDEILELPSHWSLDDWPYFGYMADSGGNTSPATTWRQNLWDEYECARDEGRNVNYVCHPEIIGRGYRFAQLAKLLESILEDGRAWLPTMEELALHVQPRLRPGGSRPLT